jgi:predicted nucleic-acid-binding Zn-ribbon protein
MGEADRWSEDVEKALSALRSRFPELTCLRCRSDKFYMRVWSDNSLVPGIATVENNQVLELICQGCGYQEKHIVKLLEQPEAA